MKYKRYFAIYLLTVFIASLVVVIPVSADLEPDFDWDVYRIDTSQWTEYPDYIQYDGTIYEVHFIDYTSGDVNGYDWEFGESDWIGSTEVNPVKIFTEEEAEDDAYSIRIKLTVKDSSGFPYDTIKYVYLEDGGFNLKSIYDLTPEPTAAPTPVPTAAPTVTPTPVPTQTAEPTPVASHVYEIAGISKEMTKLQDSYGDYINLIKAFFGKIGIQIE